MGGWGHSSLVLAVAVGIGITTVVAGSVLLKKPELRWILGRNR